MVDNATLLTSGNKAYAKKRKARREQVEEVAFDPKARRTFLTGFHKRKVERRERAMAQLKEREREDRLEMRREKREQQQELLAQKIRENKAFYGIPDSDPEESGSDEEESDDGKDVSVLRGDSSITTVTVIKDFDPTNLDAEEADLEKKWTPQTLASKLERKLSRKADESEGDDEEDGGKAKRPKKMPAKKFRYETKAKRHERNAKSRSRASGGSKRGGGSSSSKGKGRGK